MMLAGANDQQQGSAQPPIKKEESTIVKVGEASIWGLGLFFVGLTVTLLYLSKVQDERDARSRRRYA